MMLALIVNTAQTGWSEFLLVLAAAVFFVAFLLLLLRKEWPKATAHAPTLMALGFVLLAVAVLLAAL
jgi:hypothetical protein